MRIEVENEKIVARKKQEYEDLVKEMDEKGYEARLEKISIIAANVFGVVVMAIVGAVSFGAFALIYGKSALDYDKFFGFKLPYGFLFFMAMYIISIFVHEFIHGFFWHFPCEKKWGSIDFGLNIKMITPYCHCREALSVPQYFWGSIAPTLFLGIVPIIIGLIIPNLFLITFGVIGVVGGCGDIMVIWTLRKHKDCKLFDHPYEVGYAYFVEKKGGEN